MQSVSQLMFQERGQSAFDAFVTAARLKHEGSTLPSVLLSQKHAVSHTNTEWMDRVFRACAALEVGGSPLDTNEHLSEKTSHASLLKELQKDAERIAELVSTVKKERASGFLTCKVCRSTRVDVDQMQTRSADEPMTLFALCQDCGNRWTKK